MNCKYAEKNLSIAYHTLVYSGKSNLNNIFHKFPKGRFGSFFFFFLMLRGINS